MRKAAKVIVWVVCSALIWVGLDIISDGWQVSPREIIEEATTGLLMGAIAGTTLEGFITDGKRGVMIGIIAGILLSAISILLEWAIVGLEGNWWQPYGARLIANGVLGAILGGVGGYWALTRPSAA
jgi:hypothetical protein